MRTATVPWDVPVRLVPMPDVVGERRVRRVALDGGTVLPDVVAIDVVTVRAAGSDRELATDVLPVRADAAPVPPIDPAPGVATLGGLLIELAGPDASDATPSVTVAVDGTRFTRDVLAALTRVPLGGRRTYAQLAADAGRPRAVRAVASVMARNRVPLVLPCHRIVPSGGGTGRYGWGAAIKVALLDIEQHA